MRRLKLLPVLGGVPSWHVFPQPDHQLLVATEQGHAVAEARRRMEQLGRALADVAELEEPVTGGEITDCRDTICDRTTITVRVPDARRFVQLATGNHQCLFYGNLVDELHEVGRQLGLEVVDPAR